MFATLLLYIGQVFNGFINVMIQFQTASGIPFVYIAVGALVVKIVMSMLSVVGKGSEKGE